MSIETMTAKAGPFDCDGVQTEFPFAFDPLDSSYLTVYVNADIVSSGYTTTLNEGGGTVTFATPPASGARVAILRNVPPTQLVDLQNNTAFLPEVIEGMGDKLTALAQQLQEVEERAFVVPPTASGTAKDAIENMISSGGGGGGGGGGSSYEFSNEFNVTSGGSVSINKIDKEKITGLSSALDEKQDKLSSGGTYHINVDSASSAANAGYHGPFALVSSAGGSAGIYYGVNGGTLFIGSREIHVDSSGGGSTPIPGGSTVYLHFFSSGLEYETEYVMDTASAGASGHYYTRIGGNSGGKAVQYQYGDIHLKEPTSAVVSGMLAVNYENASNVYMESGYTTGSEEAEYSPLGTGLGGIVLGTIRAPANPGANFDVSLVVNQGGPGTAFEVIHSGTSEVFVSIPFGPETKFHFGAFNGTPIADLYFFPYYLVNNN